LTLGGHPPSCVSSTHSDPTQMFSKATYAALLLLVSPVAGDVVKFQITGCSASTTVTEMILAASFAGVGLVVPISNVNVLEVGSTTTIEVTPPSSSSASAMAKVYSSSAAKNLIIQGATASVLECSSGSVTVCATAAGSSCSGGGSSGPATEPAPAAPAPPETVEMFLTAAGAESDYTTSKKDQIKSVLVGLFAGLGVSVSTSNIAVIVEALASRRRRLDDRRALQSEVKITTTTTLPSGTKAGPINGELSKATAKEAMILSFSSVGITITAVEVSGAGSDGLSGGAIAGIIIGVLIAVGAAAAIFFVMKKKQATVVH